MHVRPETAASAYMHAIAREETPVNYLVKYHYVLPGSCHHACGSKNNYQELKIKRNARPRATRKVNNLVLFGAVQAACIYSKNSCNHAI
jgi:hypothetical protein